MEKIETVKISGYQSDGSYVDYMMNPFHKNITELAKKHNGKVFSIKASGTDFIIKLKLN